MNLEKQQLLDRILAWAESSPDVRGVALIGSEAQEDSSTDEWSDLDVVLSVDDPTLYLSSCDWLDHIGPFSICMVERWPTGEFRERRVLFSNGIDVDFIFLPAESCRQGLENSRIAGLVRKGVKVLLDKDGVLTSPSPPSAQPGNPPELLEFQEVAADFWFHVVYTAKKLRRGELWTAKHCCDVHMKGLLLRMIEWHARAKAGWDLDVRYKGRFLEQWADPSVVEELSEVFARYDEDDIWRALFATSNLFRRIAEETAQRLSYDWLAGQGQEAMEWASKCQSQRASVSKGDIA
ncbi:aminoglycoside 6-adenylyltransferase [Candidatus Hydrogenedentota bacterium]